MFQIDIERCTGCGDCLEVCPVEAISMKNGRAWIDQETCLECEACVQICPVDAICPSVQAIPAETVPENKIVVRQPTRIKLPAPHPRVHWTRAALTFAGREILPRVVDVVIGALERRLSQPEVSTSPNLAQKSTPRESGLKGRQRRRRKRGGFRT
jgi:NAD-dependent dihydropyrimidine dehydrogenase PreA subunit